MIAPADSGFPATDVRSIPIQGPLSAPNVFIAYECARTEAPSSEIANSIHETYARNGEDLIVEGLLAARFALSGRALAGLFYIEIGASHPVQNSNTYLFYRKYGASGVLVDTNGGPIEDMRRVRPRDMVMQAAVSAKTESERSVDRDDTPSRPPSVRIDDLFAQVADRPLDFLSIANGDGDHQLLEALDFTRFRPLIVQCEPGEQVSGTARRMTEWMLKCGYTLAAQTSASLIFLDIAGHGGAEPRPHVDSFDVFDTLIARRCVDALRIFEAMEARYGIPGFAGTRREAELAVAGPGYTLDRIHEEVARRLGMDADAAAALKQAEIDAELADAIPISENLDRVRDGDLLLSDMYLPATVIRALLAKCGLKPLVGLVVTADGKQSGRLWRQVLTGFSIGRHLGDNPHSDVAMPRRFGIVSEHTRVSEPTTVERWCLDNGLRPLGETIRAARLRISVSDPLARRLMLVQTQYNFPMLLLASVLLRRHAVATGATRLLFASRDCQLWHSLYTAVFPNEPESEYFYTSRRARVRPTAAYRAYALDRIDPHTILVDICGTGWSSALMMQALGLTGQALYFLHRIPPIALYENQNATPAICRVDAVVGPERQGLEHVRLEMCNYAPHGSATGMREIAGIAVPVFDDDDRSPAEHTLIAAQRECFATMVADAQAALLGDWIGLSNADIAEIVARLYALLCQETCLQTAFGTSHLREDMRTLGALDLLPR